MANGVREKDVNLAVASAVYWSLHGALDGIRPMLMRCDDEKLRLSERTLIAHSVESDLVVSIHVNANGAPNVRGLMAFYMPHDPVGLSVASAVQLAGRAILPRPNKRNDRPYLVTRKAWPRVWNVLQGHRRHGTPAVLVELGFATNPSDARALNDPAIRVQLAGAIIQGIAAGANLGA